MSQHEFAIVYVAVPLAVALAWLLWRARYFLRNAVLYTLAVAALLAVIRLGSFAWMVWEHAPWDRAGATQTEESAPFCLDRPLQSPPDGRSRWSCWT
jgi:hypothetical protein